MNVVDLLVVIVALAYALSGLRQGFVLGAFSTVGLVAGGVAGVLLVPRVLSGLEPGPLTSVLALVAVAVCASLGQTLCGSIGLVLRRRITWSPARVVDAGAGGLLSVAAALLVAWALGVAAAGVGVPSVSREVRGSQVLAAVDDVLPGSADDALAAFSEVVDATVFPIYLEPFSPERIPDVAPPTPRAARDDDVQAAAASVVKVLGLATDCGRAVAGSGFVYAPGRVMTNAHVVAGVDDPVIEVGGERLPARTVVYDEDRDLAVLAVAGLARPSLAFDPTARSGAQAVVLGHPGNGPLTAEPARIRAEQDLRGPDIYGDGTVVRAVYSIRAEVRPGNSGGPLVARDGDVYGVLFAASISDASTGYALTANEATPVAEAGIDARRSVSTGSCA